MQIQQAQIDVLANNLANVNTTGFRQILTRVAENGVQETGVDPNALGVENDLAKLAYGYGTRDRYAQNTPPIMSQATDMRHGNIMATGRDTDVAILNDGFFVIQTADGERYTRAGSFTIDHQNQLVTPEGNPVLGDGGPIVLAGEDFSIEEDGTVMVDGAANGRLRIVDFGDPYKLEHLGDNLLIPPQNMEAQDLPVAAVTVAQGHVEGSNVNAIDTLVAMISAQRAFEVQQKALTTEDEMLSRAVNKLPQTSG